jgi:SprT protein
MRGAKATQQEPFSGNGSGRDTGCEGAPGRAMATAQTRARDRTAVFLGLGATLIGRSVPSPRIAFDLRGQAAGQFRLDTAGRAMLRYNAVLMLRHEAEFLRQTVPHEVAHYLAYLHYGRGIRPHGPEWQQLMQALGADPRRCHEFDVTDLAARRLRRHTYHCHCGSHEVTSIRHHRMLRGARYVCRSCGEALRPGKGTGASGENG